MFDNNHNYIFNIYNYLFQKLHSIKYSYMMLIHAQLYSLK